MDNSEVKAFLALSCAREKTVLLRTKHGTELIGGILRALSSAARADANIACGVWETETRFTYKHRSQEVTSRVTNDDTNCALGVDHSMRLDTTKASLGHHNTVQLEATTERVVQPSLLPAAVHNASMIQVTQALVNRVGLRFPSIDAQAHVVCEMAWSAPTKEEAVRRFVTDAPSDTSVRLRLTRQGAMTEELFVRLSRELCDMLKVGGEDKRGSPDIDQGADGHDADLVLQGETRAARASAR